MNYYNEIDPKAAAWIQELINEKLIPDGKIDIRSIVDVQPGDLRGFTQCHFFAGIAGWSRALRLAGWPDDREIWTGSCPCQPFSAAGKGEGVNDERHLWPYFYRLICACRPRVVIGEQVASSLVVGKAGGKTDSESPVWIDGVCADMEAARYAFGATDLPAAGIGAPHIRQRLYWVAYSELPNRRADREIDGNAHGRNGSGRSSNTCRLADSECDGRRSDEPGRGQEGRAIDGRDCEAVRMGDTESSLGSVSEREERGNLSEPRGASEALGMGEPIPAGLQGHSWDGDHGSQSGRLGAIETGSASETSESGGVEDSGSDVGKLSTGKRNGPDEADSSRASSEPHGRSAFGFWSDSTWHLCRDGKSRRIPKPQVLGMVDGLSIFVVGGGIIYAKEILRAVWDRNPVQQQRERSFLAASVLLCAVSRQLGEGSKPKAELLSQVCSEAFQSYGMLKVWEEGCAIASASYRPESKKQFLGKHRRSVQPVSRGYARCRWNLGAWPCSVEHMRSLWETILGVLTQETGEDLRSIMPIRMVFPLCSEKVERRSSILKGYGNAIVPELAAEFIKAVMQEIE